MNFRDTTQIAKDLLLRSNQVTSRTAMSLVASLVAVAIGLLITLVGMSNSWTCELDSNTGMHDPLCTELRSFMGCTKISGPVRAEVLLNVKGEVKASAYLVCPWETAISEVKVCIFLTTLLGIFFGLRALSNESKKQAEFFVQSSYFFSFMLAVGSVFDFFALAAAEANNQDVCTLSGSFEVSEGIEADKLDCSYWLFSLTGYYGLVCAVLVLVSNFYMKDWKRTASDIEL